ncbi:MAG: hypothetical protein J1G30_09695 [Spirochaetales bacterium]|nr:hypothetical protein [Spirochaetales bacterium]
MVEEKKDKMFEDTVKQFKETVEEKITELKNVIQDEYLPKTETKFKENVFLTVGISLLIGFFAGFVFCLTGKHCGNKR